MELYQQRKKAVLIVDDLPKNIQVLGSMLRKEEYNVGYTTKPLDVFDLLEKRHFDLILLDVMMPEMNGYELCEKLKVDHRYKEIPVIFLTAKIDPESIVTGFEAGGQDYITKPFNTQELLARVKTHLDLREKTEILKSVSDLLRKRVAEKTVELQKKNRELTLLERVKNDFLNMMSYEIKTDDGIQKIEDIFQAVQEDCGYSDQIDQMRVSTDRLIRFSEIALLITSLKENKYEINSDTVLLDDAINKGIESFKKQGKEHNVQVFFNASQEDSVKIWGDFNLIHRSLILVLEYLFERTSKSSDLSIKTIVEPEFKIVEVTYQGKPFSNEVITYFSGDDLDKALPAKSFAIGIWAARMIQELHYGSLTLSNMSNRKGGVVQLRFK